MNFTLNEKEMQTTRTPLPNSFEAHRKKLMKQTSYLKRGFFKYFENKTGMKV